MNADIGTGGLHDSPLAHPKITAAVLREKLDKEFAGREELKLRERVVHRFLQGVYRKACNDGRAELDDSEEEEEVVIMIVVAIIKIVVVVEGGAR